MTGPDHRNQGSSPFHSLTFFVTTLKKAAVNWHTALALISKNSSNLWIRVSVHAWISLQTSTSVIWPLQRLSNPYIFTFGFDSICNIWKKFKKCFSITFSVLYSYYSLDTIYNEICFTGLMFKFWKKSILSSLLHLIL